MTISPLTLSTLAVLGFWTIELVLRRGGSASSFLRGSKDRGSTVAIVAAYILVVIALNVPQFGSMLPATVRWLGAAVALVGVVVRAMAFRTLGASYTRTLQVGKTQELVTSGIYSKIRHPGYLSALMIWIGAATATGSAIITVMAALILVSAYIYRMHAEEQMLREKYGEKYRQYRSKTWRLLPYVY